MYIDNYSNILHDFLYSLLESMDMPWETLIAPWNESDVFQWRQSKTRNQFLASLGISVTSNDNTSINQIEGKSRSASSAISHIGSSSANPSIIGGVPLKKPSLSTDNRHSLRQPKLSSSPNTSNIGKITDNFGFSSVAFSRFDEARARQLVAMHPGKVHYYSYGLSSNVVCRYIKIALWSSTY